MTRHNLTWRQTSRSPCQNVGLYFLAYHCVSKILVFITLLSGFFLSPGSQPKANEVQELCFTVHIHCLQWSLRVFQELMNKTNLKRLFLKTHDDRPKWSTSSLPIQETLLGGHTGVTSLFVPLGVTCVASQTLVFVTKWKKSVEDKGRPTPIKFITILPQKMKVFLENNSSFSGSTTKLNTDLWTIFASSWHKKSQTSQPY